MITESQFKKLTEKVFKQAKAKEVEIILNSGENSLTRYAENYIHQNVCTANTGYTIKAVFGKKVGVASSNKLDSKSMIETLKLAESLAKVQHSDPDMLPMVKGLQKYKEVKSYFPATAKLSPEDRAKGIEKAINICKKKKLEAAGIYSSSHGCFGLANNKGLFAFHKRSGATFSITASDGDASGWTEHTTSNVNKIDIEALCDEAVEKALMGINPKSVKPGKYTVVMEPAAAAEFLLFLSWLAFTPVAYQEKRSAFSGKMGKKVLGKNVTITEDPYHPMISSMPFDFEGLPKQKVELIENGVFKNMVYDRRTAKKDRKKSTGHGLPTPNSLGAAAANLVMSGGDSSLEEMVKSTKDGLYVTHFHYTNTINPKLITLTGLTRDGVFKIKNGKIAHPVNNMRFTVSAIDVLNNIESISKDSKFCAGFFGGGFVVPAIKVNDFHFTSGTQF